jgi:hypothetical protein
MAVAWRGPGFLALMNLVLSEQSHRAVLLNPP